jgi:hypothetical protein
VFSADPERRVTAFSHFASGAGGPVRPQGYSNCWLRTHEPGRAYCSGGPC